MDIDAPILSPVRQIVAVDYSAAPRRPAVPVHVPTFCKFEVVLRGRVVLFTADGQRIELRPGIGALVPPLTSHGYERRGHLIHTTVKFHLHPRYRFVLGRQVLVLDVPPYIMEVARQCGVMSVETGSAALPLVNAAATYCATFAWHAAEPQLAADAPDGARESLSQGLVEIARQPTLPWTVVQLAAMHHLSESQFTKRFRRAFGQSPQQFLIETRIIAAADYLLSTDWSIKQIAEACGYANVHGFTRAFSRVIGTPPAAYRRRMQVIAV